MTGRAYVLGGSAEPSLAEVHQEMSELLDKQVNAQKEKTFGVHAGSRKPTKKVCNENERNKQTRKNHACKNYIHGRKPL